MGQVGVVAVISQMQAQLWDRWGSVCASHTEGESPSGSSSQGVGWLRVGWGMGFRAFPGAGDWLAQGVRHGAVPIHGVF